LATTFTQGPADRAVFSNVGENSAQPDMEVFARVCYYCQGSTTLMIVRAEGWLMLYIHDSGPILTEHAAYVRLGVLGDHAKSSSGRHQSACKLIETNTDCQ
jgi:hypothetical protein